MSETHTASGGKTEKIAKGLSVSASVFNYGCLDLRQNKVVIFTLAPQCQGKLNGLNRTRTEYTYVRTLRLGEALVVRTDK